MFAIYRVGGHARVRPTQLAVRAVAELHLIGYHEQCLWKGRNLCVYYFTIVGAKSTRACIERDLGFSSYILPFSVLFLFACHYLTPTELRDYMQLYIFLHPA